MPKCLKPDEPFCDREVPDGGFCWEHKPIITRGLSYQIPGLPGGGGGEVSNVTPTGDLIEPESGGHAGRSGSDRSPSAEDFGSNERGGEGSGGFGGGGLGGGGLGGGGGIGGGGIGGGGPI